MKKMIRLIKHDAANAADLYLKQMIMREQPVNFGCVCGTF